MAEQKILEKDKKFYFDLHNFDEPYTGEEDTEEQVPTFSEEELEAAKNSAYAEGKRDGLKEAADSREQHIAQTLARIAQSFTSLFSAESYRERQYEEESLSLLRTAINRLLPNMNKRLGSDELKQIIEKTLKGQSGLSEIMVHVHPDEVTDIQALLERNWPEGTNAPSYSVLGETAFETGQCSITWADGGMVRDPNALIEAMARQVNGLIDRKTGVSEPENNAINKEGSAESSDIIENEEEPEQPGEES